MKTVTKLLMGTAALAASIGAAHAGATLPSTDNSNLLFFVTDLSTHSTYTAVLTQNINGAGGYFTSADATAAGATTGVVNTVTGDTNFTYDFTSDSALQSFISSADGSGDTLTWGIVGAAYKGMPNTQPTREPTGNTLVVASGAGSPVNIVPESTLTSSVPGLLNSDVGKLNLQTLDAYSGTTTGIYGTSRDAGGNTNENVEALGYIQSGTSIGTTAYNLYGFTGTGLASGQGLIFSLGTASFNGDELVFDGNPAGTSAVPLPAAAWLFGSGLLGLLGIGRRREGAEFAA